MTTKSTNADHCSPQDAKNQAQIHATNSEETHDEVPLTTTTPRMDNVSATIPLPPPTPSKSGGSKAKTSLGRSRVESVSLAAPPNTPAVEPVGALGEDKGFGEKLRNISLDDVRKKKNRLSVVTAVQDKEGKESDSESEKEEMGTVSDNDGDDEHEDSEGDTLQDDWLKVHRSATGEVSEESPCAQEKQKGTRAGLITKNAKKDADLADRLENGSSPPQSEGWV